MIISFNPLVFNSKDGNIQAKLADILVKLIENKHFIETTSINGIFYTNGKYSFNKSDLAVTHLSAIKKRQLEEYLNSIIGKSAYITRLHKQFLTSVIIGESTNEIHPNDALKLISERSKIILENGINDWDFIRGVCDKYTSHRKRASIYNLIKQSINNEDLVPDHAGGVGGFVARINYWRETKRCGDIYKYKIIAVFDSDKPTPTDYSKSNPGLLKFLKCKVPLTGIPTEYIYEKQDKVIWHMLYKKKLENYVPLSVLKSNIATLTATQISDLDSKTEIEIDFIEYNEGNIGISEKKIKDQFPKMFLTNFSLNELEKRCEHHKVRIEVSNGVFEEVTEMEEILLKIGKII